MKPEQYLKGRHLLLAPTMHPTTRDLDWAAGFLEGEGSFIQTHVRSRYTSRTIYGERVTAPQKDRECLDRLCALFGGSVGFRAYKRCPIWSWQLTGSRARGVMMTLYLLLSARRKTQIQRALTRGC